MATWVHTTLNNKNAAFCAAPGRSSATAARHMAWARCSARVGGSVARGQFVRRRGVAARAAAAAQWPRATTATMVVPSLATVGSTGAGVLVLGFIVFVHECGHYLAARWQNIRVKNFSIGFGPKLWSFTPAGSETEFTVRLLPLGGYVAFPEPAAAEGEGEGGDAQSGERKVVDGHDDDARLLQNRPIAERAVVISAGVIANLILAWSAVFTSTAVVGVPTYVYAGGVQVMKVVDVDGPAARAGILEGDVIVAVDGTAVGADRESAARVAEQIRDSRGRTLRLGVERAGGGQQQQQQQQQGRERVEVRVEPRCCTADGSSVVGVQLNAVAEVRRQRATSVAEAVGSANAEFWRLCSQTWRGLAAVVAHPAEGSRALSGPIGVVSVGAQLARDDAWTLLPFCAVISINLALMNALPLPALDGGQLVLLAVEAVRGAPVSRRVQNAINSTALLLLLAGSGALFVGDLQRLLLRGLS